MNAQIGFDFGETRFDAIESPEGTWKFEGNFFEHPSLVVWLDGARKLLLRAPEALHALFLSGFDAASTSAQKAADADANGKYCFDSLDRFDVEADVATVETFAALCRTGVRCGQTTDVVWKIRENFAQATFAVHVDGIGSLFAERWVGRDEWRMRYQPGSRDKFFRESYLDGMNSVELPYAIWGPAYAADKIACSGKGVASVSPFVVDGRQYILSDSMSGLKGQAGLIFGTAWRLGLPEQWNSETYSYHSQGVAADCGRLQRGDRRGLVVAVRGTKYVLEAAMIVFDPQGRDVRLDRNDQSETSDSDDDHEIAEYEEFSPEEEFA
ncbi:hypothetical protein [Paraburkholderia sp. SIMBA_054]|uniref:hypothetical protein n=1 Tax=Paraburkholderia sp. SIMBA_054 TaxID=3085795 RepID=UPI00397A1F59